ncbi:uncharacterized protein [Miscanthus floridulus]|uniref:uncharacterized protein n=1 Tax=Miscanthus floridulus TaxID=154761 RepID=UPI00345B2D1B
MQTVVKDVGAGGGWPMLIKINYAEWSMVMKVKMQARRMWDAVRYGDADFNEDRRALEALLVAPGADIDDFALRLNTLMQQLARYDDDDIDEERAVKKFLRVVPNPVGSIDRDAVDISELTIEEVIGHLKAVDHHEQQPSEPVTMGGKLLFAEEQRLARQPERKKGEASGSSSSHKRQPHKRDKACGGAPDDADGERKDTHDDTCKNCGRTGHWAKDCRQEKRGGQTHVAQAQEGDEAALFFVHGSIELHSPPAPATTALLHLNETWAHVFLDNGTHLLPGAACSKLEDGAGEAVPLWILILAFGFLLLKISGIKSSSIVVSREIKIEALLGVENLRLFSYGEIRAATNNFDQSNKLGRGGFGTVYKGVLRDGTEFAAKVLSSESEQGIKEFLAEIESISEVKHANLVRLLGCCVQRKNRILVYEYLANNSLDHALKALGSGNGAAANLPWSRRSDICVGTAKGLSYLHAEHEPNIVHRDIKASNVLLDRDYMPKIGDFGLAKLFPDNVTHISTGVVGTYGYLAPEYFVHGQLTKKADVYSFGVLVLEIVSGRRISQTIQSDMFLVREAWVLYQQGRLLDIVDASMGSYPEKEVLRYIKVGLACTQATPSSRPTMRQVLDLLSRPVALPETEMCPPSFAEHRGHHTAPGGLPAGPLVLASPRARWPAAAAAAAAAAPKCSVSFTYSEVAPR